MSENRVLALDEVLALEEGTRVWVEERPNGFYRSAVHARIDENEMAKLMDCNGGWYPITAEWVGGEYRVWSIPVAPTREELAANPWGLS